jgi:altronate hydrolase
MTEKQAVIRIHPDDTVVVALRPLKNGEVIALPGGEKITAAGDISAGHKMAVANIAAGDKIIKYGHSIGGAIAAIPAGSHVHTHNMKTLLSEAPEYHYDPKAAAAYAQTLAAEKDVPDIDVFRRKDGQVGIRNEVWIVPTVGCVNRTAEALASWANAECVKTFGIDGVYAWTHPYGCSQMGEDHATTRTILADLVKHPNAGAVLVIGLGCENNTVEEFKKVLGDYDAERVQFLVTQQASDEIAEGREILKKLAAFAGQFKREKAKASELIIGMKCGGSDGFSGITANALVGQVCDAITTLGGSAILTEVPEMFGAEQMLMDRCETRELFEKTVSLITDFKDYYTSHNQVVYENPSPGNKDGGITTLEDKSCGCVQKGGKAPVRGVYKYGERICDKGLQLLEGPGNDIVSTTAMTAAGAHIILFTTGRGTPLGAPVPTVKISSNSDLAQRKPNWIDFDAGRMLEEDAALVRDGIMQLIFDIASGKKQTRNEINGYREIAIFKDGVTL